jgi:hypothetical protein
MISDSEQHLNSDEASDPIDITELAEPGGVKNAEAVKVVESTLMLKEFIDDHKHQIYERLEECIDTAKKAAIDNDVIFIAESLPIINGIIYVGSRREILKGALDQIRADRGKDSDPYIVLSAYVLIYIVNRGAEEFKHSEDMAKQARWGYIQKLAQRLL